jgi:nucleoid DNA-binding protein
MLNPKKPNQLIKEVSEELNLSQSQVDDIVSFYWAAIRKYMEAGEEPLLDVENLGLFYVKRTSLNKQIQKNEEYLKFLNPANISRFNFYIETQKKLKRFKALTEKMDINVQTKKDFKQKKKNDAEKD